MKAGFQKKKWSKQRSSLSAQSPHHPGFRSCYVNAHTQCQKEAETKAHWPSCRQANNGTRVEKNGFGRLGRRVMGVGGGGGWQTGQQGGGGWGGGGGMDGHFIVSGR